ncbi:4-hydroxythreonine-4-phosphate dehydrogenase PdxA [Asticcacaulis sp. EMRT-3]|uniref:4-hydroxythreonine-4-phosphate dehydrogenase PdxA n=1 Tax=Asticcacaulis sp. EMRT-3 TaxID=3040349 RepID=UPI0024AF83AE|nr:4-hydroxythreonine-4-phosphate dehydrogenase PdxA [Asticcacaulis sp. EMRT-3]MDI7774577.1 4-hydroxythreonine-4-phosphate dehydrogenase PdxA [Asticcacaulis sp. EMRT-3]
MADLSAPLIISLGDPCGIGPEIIASAWRALKDEPELAFCVVGDGDILARHDLAISKIASPEEATSVFHGALPVLHRPLSAAAIAGQPDAAHAPHIIAWIREATELCLKGTARALITAPIAKSVLYGAGFAFPGHTEYLAELCRDETGLPLPVMMLTAPDAANGSALRVVLATIHTPLAEVAARLSQPGLIEIARITHQALIRDFGIAAPRLAMAGLNPHAGEDGTIGREEIDILSPAAHHLRNESIDISDPLPADTLFHEAARRTYDAVICMYHDQGLIPLKTLDFWRGVNVTLGLPIARTSPDHGTGFAIAGQGKARPDSLIEAIRLAHTIARHRQGFQA